jgi:hypothetical protein
MHTSQFHYSLKQWQQPLPNNSKAQLVFAFGSRDLMTDTDFNTAITHAFPNANIIGCTTSGEILDTEIHDHTLVVSALEFENTPIEVRSENIKNYKNLNSTVDALVKKLPLKNLKHVIVIADGQNVNGSELAKHLTHYLPPDVTVTGGLAGDDDRFKETFVWHNNSSSTSTLLICGLYGDAINIGFGSLGGWSPFGPLRLITKSQNNVLYELDNGSALSLYKEYLGDFASELPASALRFPLSLRIPDSDDIMVRTILNINEQEQSLTFAGDLPQGTYVSFMRANTDRLVNGAEQAAKQALKGLNGNQPQFALLISCVGRRLVLKQETEYELESVQDVFSENCAISGFYSYGELSPMQTNKQCALHNQTMTITTFFENT